MPEIKHNFTGGKMNKDLDERLVPNGEYRDAMNIQVATSEGSDVGTAQNILGNELKELTSSLGFYVNLEDEAVVIGAVSDEKIDTMYYLVWSSVADYIFSYNGVKHELVFVDKDKTVLKFLPSTIITGINIIDGMLFWTDNTNEPRKINIQRCIDGTDQDNQTKLLNNSTGALSVMEEKHITVIKKAPQVSPRMEFTTQRDSSKIYTAVIEISSADNASESSFAATPTDAYNFSSFSTDEGENEFWVDINKGINQGGNEVDFPATNPLKSLTGIIPAGTSNTNAITMLIGRDVVLQAYSVDDTSGEQSPPGLPLTDFVMKGTIVAVGGSLSHLRIKLTSIDGFPDVASGGLTLKYVIDFYNPEEKLFEFKYPRFSYRYKFEDGEYSPFAPFTQVAFSPGSFDYHPRKGYNIGMTNRLKSVELFDIVTEQTPSDVVSIDILFKDDASPSVYVVDTIKPNDYSVGDNIWTRMLDSSSNFAATTVGFNIERETISSIIPSNQLLRPWDNVPRKALAQDVTGNRVVYANYTQNYNLETSEGEKYVPSFKFIDSSFDNIIITNLTGSNSASTKAFKSIKSLREYQLGVVFLDEYGRETPVISNYTGVKKYDKKSGDKANRIGVKFSSDDYPQSLTHFKFFIKETSTEYYNMAMDRWYSAGDNNIWLAFPSSDRNKIDIDTFLILKKGADKDELVIEEARYKVLAIENEAPDFIKTTKRKAISIRNSNSRLFGGFGEDSPFEGLNEFKMDYAPFRNTSGGDLASVEDELWVEFGMTNEDIVSDRYRIVSITNNLNADETNLGDSQYSIQLESPLGDDVNFITDDPNGNSPNFIENEAIVNIYKYKVENLDRFDGRFFVKIYFDEVFRNNIESTTVGGGFRKVASRKVYSMDEDLVAKHTADLGDFLLNPESRGESKTKAYYQEEAAGGNVWNPTENNGEESKKNLNIYGYYNVRDFTANALYFRKYRLKKWDLYDGVGAWQTPSVGLEAAQDVTIASFRDWFNEHFDVFVHLKNKSGGSSVEATASYLDNDYEDADDWHKEIGYKTTRDSLRLKYHFDYGAIFGDDGGLRQDTNTKGVTANWYHKRAPIPTTYTTLNWSYYREDFEEGGYKSDRASARDNEVWFIDKGPIAGKADRWASDAIAWHWNKEPGFNSGITSYTNEWRMYLSFGGLLGHKPQIEGDDANAGFGFWQVGDWNNTGNDPVNSYYNEGFDKKFINKLNGGEAFKWREDNVSTEPYYIGGSEAYNNFRHSHGIPRGGYGAQDSTDYNTKSHIHTLPDTESIVTIDADVGLNLDSMAEGLSFNRTKAFRLGGIEPALAWDPTTDGIISGGLSINLTAVSDSGNLTTGSTVTATALLSDDVIIYVSSLVDGTNMLHVGMALTQHTTSGVLRTLNGDLQMMAIRHIEFVNNAYYALTLGGYKEPLNSVDHTIRLLPPDIGTAYNFRQVGMNGYSPNSEFNINTIGRSRGLGAVTAVGYHLDFVEEIQPIEVLSENPAIWETEPKESTELDIYYEASGAIPAIVDEKTVASAFPVGTKFGILVALTYQVFIVVGHNGDKLTVMNTDPLQLTTSPGFGGTGYFNRPDNLTLGAQILSVTSVGGNQWDISVEENLVGNSFELPWHNCYSFGNGVESNRIRDNFNLPYISNGVKASTTLEQEYEEEHRKYGLIYSGIYNSTSGINNLNQFIAGEKITKDVNPIYGSIQKLYSRDSDLVTLCEDKILRIVANKDALFNADGNPQLIATDRVLGQTIPFTGEYGISTNPESFAKESYRAYFTDRVRGAVMRLSKDGLTPISDAGMKDWFRDNLKVNKKLVGSYDDRNDEYNLLLTNEKFFTTSTRTTASYQFAMPGATTTATPSTPVQPAALWFSQSQWNGLPFNNALSVGDGLTLVDASTGASMVPLGTTVTSVVFGISVLYTGGFGQDFVKVGISNNIINQLTNNPPTSYLQAGVVSNSEISAGFMQLPLMVMFLVDYQINSSLLSFSEKVGGWVSRKSFVDMQMGLSLANDYYTFYKGNLYLHYSETEDRNTFYGIFEPSSLDVILNNDPGAVKVFNTLNYEGSQAFVNKFTYEAQKEIPLQPDTDYSDQEYYNLYEKKGWSVESIVTNKEEGKVNEFLEKEGKWFNGINKVVSRERRGIVDSSDFTLQGVGVASVAPVYGCTNPLADNYNPLAEFDDGSCSLPKPIKGCMDPSANNYNPLAEISTNTCTYDIPKPIKGCMDPSANNYDPLAEISTNTCTYDIIIGPADVRDTIDPIKTNLTKY